MTHKELVERSRRIDDLDLVEEDPWIGAHPFKPLPLLRYWLGAKYCRWCGRTKAEHDA